MPSALAVAWDNVFPDSSLVVGAGCFSYLFFTLGNLDSNVLMGGHICGRRTHTEQPRDAHNRMLENHRFVGDKCVQNMYELCRNVGESEKKT